MPPFFPPPSGFHMLPSERWLSTLFGRGGLALRLTPRRISDTKPGDSGGNPVRVSTVTMATRTEVVTGLTARHEANRRPPTCKLCVSAIKLFTFSCSFWRRAYQVPDVRAALARRRLRHTRGFLRAFDNERFQVRTQPVRFIKFGKCHCSDHRHSNILRACFLIYSGFPVKLISPNLHLTLQQSPTSRRCLQEGNYVSQNHLCPIR